MTPEPEQQALKEQVAANQKIIDQLNGQLGDRTHQIQIIQTISHEINTTLDLDRVFDLILETMDREFGFRHAMILLTEPGRDELRVVASHGYQGRGVGATVRFGQGVIGVVAKNKKMLRMVGIGTRGRYLRVAGEAAGVKEAAIPLPGLPDVKSQIALPLVVKGELIGVFAVESSVMGAFKAVDELVCGIVGNQMGAAISNAQAYKVAQDLTQHLEERVAERTLAVEEARRAAETARDDTHILADLARRANSQDLDGLALSVAEILKSRYRMNRLALYGVDEKNRELVLRSAFFRGRSFLGEVNPLLRRIPIVAASGTVARTYQRGKTLYVNRVKKELLAEGSVDAAFQAEGNFDSFVQTPLIADGTVVGLLMFSGPADAKLRLSDLHFCERMAAQVAGIVRRLEYVREVQEARRHAEESAREAAMLAEFSRRINEHADLERIVTDISRYAVESMNMRGAFLGLFDPECNELYSAGGYVPGATPEQQEYLWSARIPMQPAAGTFYLTLTRERTLYIRDFKTIGTETDREIARLFGLTSFLHIPLIVRGKVRGVMAFNPGSLRLRRADIQRLEAYVDQIAGAVYTSGLLQSVQRERAAADELRQETETLNQMLKRVAQLDDIQAIMGAVMKVVGARYGIEHYGLYSLDRERHRIELISATFPEFVSEEDREKIRTTPIDLSVPGSYAMAYRRRKLSYFPRIYPEKTSGIERFVVDRLNLKSYVICPLVVQNEIAAFLSFTSYRSRSLTKQQLGWLSLVSDQIAGVIRTNKLMQTVKQERAAAEQARGESDRLLNNILPVTVAEELKREGAVTPHYYENVTVLFTDFVGFTNASEKMLPHELVKELDGCFSQFDEVIRRNNMEKLKTIGDAYMCAGGLPEINRTHPVDVCLAALEFRAFMDQMAQVKIALGEEYWRIRIGIHTGPVTAGVIGTNKFAYDIWGDTVNTASRMESSGAAGRINVSAETYDIVRDLFDFEYRGKVRAKGKGEMDMFFLERIKSEYAADDEGLVPNARFEQLRAGIRVLPPATGLPG